MIDADLAYRLRLRGLKLPLDPNKYVDPRLFTIAVIQNFLLDSLDNLDKELIGMLPPNTEEGKQC